VHTKSCSVSDRLFLHKQDVVDLLPPNYHNSTEHQTQIGNEDVDVQENIDKTSDDYSGVFGCTVSSQLVWLIPGC